MKTIEKIEYLRDYLAINRQVGHTTLLLTGSISYDRESILLVQNTDQFRDMNQILESASTLSRKHKVLVKLMGEPLNGYKMPIAIDNALLWDILNAASSQINYLLSERKDRNANIKKCIEKLNAAKKLNDAAQSFYIIGDDKWHRCESIDDRIFDALELLGD